MSAFYYLYDPADNLALGQAIHLANTDGGMSYIVPFANKTGVVDPNDPASAGLGVIETAIAAGPLHVGGTNDPVSNRLTPAQFQGKVSADQWTAIKAMVKASINQAPPAGWSEASLEDATSTYSVISADAYHATNQLKTHVFTAGAWQDADTSKDLPRGNPYIAFGGKVTDAAFIDYSGHHIPTAGYIGESVVDTSGRINNGLIYNSNSTDIKLGEDDGSPVYGLSIDAGAGKAVTLVNFSATSQGLGRSHAAFDNLPFTNTGNASLGTALHIYSGDITLGGDFVVDQFTQVVDGMASIPGAVQITSGNSRVTFDKARILLGSVRGFDALISVKDNALLDIRDSTIYGFGSSNSDAPPIFGAGLDWAKFSENPGSAAIAHLISSSNNALVRLENSTLLREDYWYPQGDYLNIASNMTRQWRDNDYNDISNGELGIGVGGKMEILNSRILGSVISDIASTSLTVRDSVIAGAPVGKLQGASLMQLSGGSVNIENSLIDSLDTRFLGGGSLQQDSKTHILASATPWAVSTTTTPTYTALSTFAAQAALQHLEGWADIDIPTKNYSSKVRFQFQGPTGAALNPGGVSRTLPVLLSESALPQVAGNGATNFSLAARFLEPVSGFDATDLQTALGTAAVQAGWKVTAAPVSSDGGRNWKFQLTSPVGFSTPVTLNLAAGAAKSTLVSGLASDASNSFSLTPVGTSSGGGSSSPGLDNDNLDESPQNNNGIIIDANKDGIPDANQSYVAGIRRVGDGTSPGDYAALAVAADYTLDAVTLLPITNNKVQVSLPSGGSISTPIPNGVTALLEPLEFHVKDVKPGATIKAEVFIPDNFNQETDAYMRFNYKTKRFEEYVDVNSKKLYQLLDEDADGKVDRVVFSLTDGDNRWDGDGLVNGIIVDPGSPIEAQLRFSGNHKKDTITGNLLSNRIKGKAGNDHLLGGLGKDRIHGGKGRDHVNGGEQGDLLIGGHGRDHFVYTSAADSSADNLNQQDKIRQFHHQDRIDLRRIDADTTEVGRQSFSFISAHAFSGNASELRFSAGLLSADLDGDRRADFAVAIDGGLKASQLML